MKRVQVIGLSYCNIKNYSKKVDERLLDVSQRSTNETG